MDKELLIGLKVTNKAGEKGTVKSFEEGRLVVVFANREASFHCPQAFGQGFITAEDSDIQDKLIKEAERIKEQSEKEKLLRQEEHLKKHQEDIEKRGERGSHRSVLYKGESFRTHAEALNECFGYGYKHFQMAYKQIDDNYGAWFPSIAKRVMGEYVAADTSAGWLNILCENDTVILEKHVEDPNKNITRDKSGYRFVFAKYDGRDDYTFIGLYSSDPVPTKEGFRYELIGTQIDLNTMQVIK